MEMSNFIHDDKRFLVVGFEVAGVLGAIRRSLYNRVMSVSAILIASQPMKR